MGLTALYIILFIVSKVLKLLYSIHYVTSDCLCLLKGCSGGYQEVSGLCAKFTSESLSYSAALSACRAESATLLEVTSHPQEFAMRDWIRGKTGVKEFWMGLEKRKERK